jgi:KaiC/GvpD/RAD55 family RecA-like ATPase
VDLVRIMGELPEDQKADVIRRLLEDAKPTGVHAELLSETEEVLAGERNVIDWPWPFFATVTESIAAANAVVICGEPGVSKSLFLLQALLEWHKAGISCAVMQLESGAPYHLRRGAAMISECSHVTSMKWQRSHPDETRKILGAEILTSFGRCLHDLSELPNKEATVDNLVRWINEEVQRGIRIISIDPVTLAEFGKDMHSEDSKFVRGIKRALDGSKSSFIAITHPRPGSHGRTLDNMALTRDWGRHTPSAMWYEYVHPAKKMRVRTVSTAMGQVSVEMSVNRVIHVLKVRDTEGAKTKIAFDFDRKSLKVRELGEVVD